MGICDPAADQRGDVEYKTAMAGEMTQRALRCARTRAAKPHEPRRRPMAKKQAVSFKLNGKAVDVVGRAARAADPHPAREARAHRTAHRLRNLHCGACTVDLDGMSVKSCTVLTVQCEGAEVLTIEGFEQGGALHALQEAFTQEHGLQCGYCTPGMLTRAYRLLQGKPGSDGGGDPLRMAGNLCRCTGYQNIVKAVQHAAQEARGAATA